jgi:hypothetical protein
MEYLFATLIALQIILISGLSLVLALNNYKKKYNRWLRFLAQIFFVSPIVLSFFIAVRLSTYAYHFLGINQPAGQADFRNLWSLVASVGLFFELIFLGRKALLESQRSGEP